MKSHTCTVYKDKAGFYRWRLKASNGRVIAQNEDFPTKAHAMRAAKMIVGLLLVSCRLIVEG